MSQRAINVKKAKITTGRSVSKQVVQDNDSILSESDDNKLHTHSLSPPAKKMSKHHRGNSPFLNYSDLGGNSVIMTDSMYLTKKSNF